MGGEKVEKIKSFKRSLDKTVLTFTSILAILMVIIVFIQVVARYVFQNSLSWSEEIARYMLVWLIFLSAGYVLGQRAHIFLDVVFNAFPLRLQKVLRQVSNVLLLGFSLIVTYFGCEMMKLGSSQISSAVQLPMWLVYLALPVGGLLLVIYSLLEMIFAWEEQRQ